MQQNLAPFNPPETAVQQNGDRSVAVIAQPGSIINIAGAPPQQMPGSSSGGSAAQLMGIESFSTDYYQLLVTTQQDVFSTCVVHMRSDRALSAYNVPKEIFSRCSELTPEGIRELMGMPAIVCNENTQYDGQTDPGQMAVYGRVTHILTQHGSVDVLFEPIRVFPQAKMCAPRAAAFFGIDIACSITTLNRTAWHVMQRNLFEAFRQAGIEGMPGPSKEVGR